MPFLLLLNTQFLHGNIDDYFARIVGNPELLAYDYDVIHLIVSKVLQSRMVVCHYYYWQHTWNKYFKMTSLQPLCIWEQWMVICNQIKRCITFQHGGWWQYKYAKLEAKHALVTPWECLHVDVMACTCFKAIKIIATI